ncbi:MAG: hypothetical protein V1907_00440 [Candidatus Kerfeldbacteria bacterium]
MLRLGTRSIIAFVVMVLAVSAVLMIVPAVRESQTSDEATYVVSGLSYWKTGDFRLNVEHPPLLKELLSLPAFVRGARFFANASDWNGASQWDVAPKVLYGNSTPGSQLLTDARFVNVLLALILIVVTSWWSFKTWGKWGGLVTLIIVAFEPNLLAHGHLATTDVGYALGVIGSLVTFGFFLERPVVLRMVVAAAVFSFALLTRFNALLLIVLLPIQYFVTVQRSRGSVRLDRRTLMKTVLVFFLMSVVVVWACYGFEVRSLDRVQDSSAREQLELFGAFGRFLERIPLPAASYMSGTLWQLEHSVSGQIAYLFGNVRMGGWWYYYPTAIVIKMTLGALALVLIALFIRKSSPSKDDTRRVFTGTFIAVPATVLMASAMITHLDIGVRYALPVICMLVVTAGASVTIRMRAQARIVIVVALLCFHIASVVRAFPHFIPYANEAFGGSQKLSKYLVDSNLDWGQDLDLLRQYFEKNNISDYRLSPFSNVPLWAYGLQGTAAPSDGELAFQPYSGVVAIGVTELMYNAGRYQWLARSKPTAIIGHSINVYDFRDFSR